MRIVGLGRGFFAIASASLAIWSLAYGDSAWIYGAAVILLAASVGLCFSRTALASSLTIGAYQAVAAAIAVPQILAKPLSIDAWYPFCEAVTALVGAWVLYALLQRQSRGSGLPIVGDGAVRAAQIVFGLTCVFYGWSHFVYAAYTASMVPTWLPGRLPFAYFTGLGHAAAGLAIIVGILPRLAATLEALMMSLFGLLVWVPSFFAHPRPEWAKPPQNQWSELVVTAVLAASAWIVAASFKNRPWRFVARSRA
jgi:uncharacterized membrane protein YphA (DoxX/SURF4 family)